MGPAAKRLYRALTICGMIIATIAATIFVIYEVGKIENLPYPTNLGKGLMTWLKGVILCQAVLLIGGLLLFMLRKKSGEQ